MTSYSVEEPMQSLNGSARANQTPPLFPKKQGKALLRFSAPIPSLRSFLPKNLLWHVRFAPDPESLVVD